MTEGGWEVYMGAERWNKRKIRHRCYEGGRVGKDKNE
jgi:hypothetical protein